MGRKTAALTAKATPRTSFRAMREPSVAPFIPKDDPTQVPYVFHGTDNLYPEGLRKLVDNCAPLERSITQLAEFIAGKGPRFYDQKGEEIQGAMDLFQEWMKDSSEEEFMAQTAYDLSHGLGLSWTARRAAGAAVVRLDHASRFEFRAGKTEKGKIPAMYRSADWREAEWNSTSQKFKPKAIPTLDWTGKELHEEAIIFERQYHPIEPVYGRIFWLGARRAAEVWVKVDNYNRTQIDTGFTGAVLLGTRFDGTDAEIERHEERIDNALTGSMGKALMNFTLGTDEKDPFFQELARGNHAGELDGIRSGCAEVIFETFGIPSLLMRDRAEGLTSQRDAISIRLQQFQRTAVATMQRLPGRALTRLMNLSGIPVWETRFQPLEIFDPVQSEAMVIATTTVDEAREMRGDDPHPDEKVGKMLVCQAQKLASDPEEAKAIAQMKAKQPIGKEPFGK